MMTHRLPVFDADGHVIEDIADIYTFYEGKFEKTMLNPSFSLFPSLDGWQRGSLNHNGQSNQFGKGQPTDISHWEVMLDRMGLEGSVLYPTQGLAAGLMNNDEWVVATATAYNNWIEARFTSPSARLFAAGMLPVRVPKAAAKELERCATKRTRFPAMVVPSVTNTGKYFGDEFFWPIYEAAEAHDMALAFHGAPSRGFGIDNFDELIKVHTLEHPVPLMIQMTDMILSGVFDRFPKLRVAFLEGGCAWIPFMMDRLDYEYGSIFGAEKRRQLKKKPSDYFRDGENIWVSMELGETSLKYVVDAMGSADRVLYASDFPHEPTEEALMGELPEFIESNALSDEVKRKVLHDNCKAFYRMH